MAPPRKTRNTNKRSSVLNKASPVKKQQKKKFSNLGSRWSKEELGRFYEAYRQHGKDWKKVATVVRNRSVEMVESLYNMNRAYLSLPEGIASVAGLIAKMKDRYNVLEDSESERESNDAPGSQKLVKQTRGKVQLRIPKDPVQSPSIVSKDGCLSLLKRTHSDGNQVRPVGKRTPRTPVRYPSRKDDRENYVSSNKRSLQSAFDANDDEIAHGTALALTEAVQRDGSPQVSQIPYKRSERMFSHVHSCERMRESETVPSKFYDTSVNEERFEGSIEVGGAEKREYTRDTNSLINMEGIGSIEVHPKVDRDYRNTEKRKTVGNHRLDDGGETSSGTEEGLNFCLKEKVPIEVTNAKPKQYSPSDQRMKKRVNNFFSEDESCALDALQTLADLSLMELPTSTRGSESSDKDEKSALPGGTSASQNRDKVKLPGSKQKIVHTARGVEVSTPKKSKLGRESVNDTNTLFESKAKLPSADKTWKRKFRSISKAIDEENTPVIMGKHIDHSSALAKQLKLVVSLESPLSSDQKNLSVPTAEVPLVGEVKLSTKQRSRRKTSLKRMFMPKEKSSENILKSQPKKFLTSVQNGELFLKEKLSSCLSSNMVRRWCLFEWFYSAIDYPWFSKRECLEYLHFVGIGNISRLTRVEWNIIKGSLGKPRRFSEHFIREERQELERYRESVRKHYTELRTGIKDGLPTDLPKPLYVGQRVIAFHSKTGEIHDGVVLTVDHDKCRVQFDRPDLGVEFVMDIDCMPLNLLDNMSEALWRQISTAKVPSTSKEPQMKRYSSFGGSSTGASSGPVEKEPTSSSTLAKQYKEKLLMELTNANNGVMENQNDANCFKHSEAFRTHYTMGSNAPLDLRQHNTYAGNSLPPCKKSQASFNVHDGLPNKLDSSLTQELGSTVVEIIKGSRLEAYTMVNTALQAFSSMKEGEDTFMRIRQELDCIDYLQLVANSRLPVIKSQEQVNGTFDYHNRSIRHSLDPLLNDASDPKLHRDSNKVEIQVPSDLITSCVAILIMIQTCTERQYPPADVAQILDSAVSSLHPCSQRNLPVYREIQMCMGRIKTQILSLVPI